MDEKVILFFCLFWNIKRSNKYKGVLIEGNRWTFKISSIFQSNTKKRTMIGIKSIENFMKTSGKKLILFLNRLPLVAGDDAQTVANLSRSKLI